jgi:hypothetical protein
VAALDVQAVSVAVTHEIIAVTVVEFEETGETRSVLRDCARCFAAPEVYGQAVLSPTGIAHIAVYETTICGHDATRENWWWKL